MRRMYGLVIVSVSAWSMSGCGSSLDKPQNEQVVGGEVAADLDGETIKQSLIEKRVPGITAQTKGESGLFRSDFVQDFFINPSTGLLKPWLTIV